MILKEGHKYITRNGKAVFTLEVTSLEALKVSYPFCALSGITDYPIFFYKANGRLDASTEDDFDLVSEVVVNPVEGVQLDLFEVFDRDFDEVFKGFEVNRNSPATGVQQSAPPF